MALLQKAYLGATPLFRNAAWFQDDVVSFVSQGSATVTASASTNTKGSYTEIIASTAANASALLIVVEGISGATTNTAALIDIAFGAAGSESIKIADVAVGGARTSGSQIEIGSIQFIVPFQVLSGTRIAARMQGVIASDTALVFIRALDCGDYSSAPTSVDTVGGNTADSTGIAMSGSSGTWVQLIASTSRAYRALVIVPSLSGTNIATSQQRFDIGTGAAGSEVAFGFISARYGSDESVVNTLISADPVLPKAISAGTRVAIRHSLSTAQSSYQFTVIGIP